MTDKTAMLAGLLAAADVSLDEVLAAAAAAGVNGATSGPVGDQDPTPAFTMREFYGVVRRTAEDTSENAKRGGGMLRTYEPYLRLLVEGYPYASTSPAAQEYAGIGDKLVRDVTLTDLAEADKWVRRRSERDGATKAANRRGAGRHVKDRTHAGAHTNYYAAVRYFFKVAVANRIISDDHDPTTHLKKPNKPTGQRRALTEAQLAEVWTTVMTGGDDPELDALLVETVLVTAARRDGLLNLTLGRLDRDRATVWLFEKGGFLTEQPATVGLVDALEQFARSRGASRDDDPVFCAKLGANASGPRAITSRRFDTLHTRIQKQLPWADKLGLTIHWIRHHAITQVDRQFGPAVAARYARHANTSTTCTYTKATGEEVCAAVSALTGTTHPLAAGGW